MATEKYTQSLWRLGGQGEKIEKERTENSDLVPGKYSKQGNICLQFSMHIVLHEEITQIWAQG